MLLSARPTVMYSLRHMLLVRAPSLKVRGTMAHMRNAFWRAIFFINVNQIALSD